jgi:hypothetical protein
VRINEIHLVAQNAYQATVSLDVSGKPKSDTNENRWTGTIELENNHNKRGLWKIE